MQRSLLVFLFFFIFWTVVAGFFRLYVAAPTSQEVIFFRVILRRCDEDAEKNVTKIGIVVLLLVFSSFASVMYAFATTEKREVIYSNTITIDAEAVKFRGFYLSSPAVYV